LASQIDKAEAAKDYAGAVALLRYTLDANLQNADVHHRLAADLLYAGQTADALSEFRIASALAPTRKDFADDLAKAMQVHKASQLASDTQAGGGK
jgi:Flp pilus assembly protein TadD